IAVLVLGVHPAAAQGSCGTYAHAAGGVEVLADGAIAATSSVAVSFLDPASVDNARMEAEADARTAVAHFFSDTIKDDGAIAKMVNESTALQGDSKAAARKDAVARIARL